jgi:DNA-binding MarR family transcriptional regulator
MHPLFFGVKRVHLCVQRLSRALCEEWDLEVTPAQLDMLRIVFERQGVARWQLVDLLGIAGPAVSRMLGVLERGGWVERRRAKWDARYVLVRLTARGSELVAFALEGPLSKDHEAIMQGCVSRSDPPSADAEKLEGLLLGARIRLGDSARFIHPWMRVLVTDEYTLAKPPPPAAIFP